MKKQLLIEGMQISRLNLKFSDNAIEKSFHTYYAGKYLFQLRLAHILAVVFYVLAAFGDFLLVEFSPIHILIRVLFAVPAFIAGFILSFLKRVFYLKYYQVFNCIYVLLTGLSFIYVGAIAESPINYFFYNGLIVSLIFNYTFIKQDFIKSSLTGALLLILYFISLQYDDVNFNYAFHGILYLTIMNFLGMFIAYTIELDGRKAFLTVRNLQEGKKKEEEMNAKLERIVDSRTKRVNNELKERKIAEEQLIKYRDSLEKIIEKRTKEISIQNKLLVSKNEELENFNKLFIDREFRIKELRDKIEDLENQIKRLQK